MDKKTVWTIAILMLIIITCICILPRSSFARSESTVSPVKGIWSQILKDQSFASPSVANRAVYVGSNKGILYILDARSGKLSHKFKTDYRSPCYPLVSGDGNVYLSTNNGALYAVNAFTGKLQWSLTETASDKYSNLPELPYYYVYKPAQSSNLLFFSTPTSTLYAVDAETGSINWNYQSKASFITYPVVYQDEVYIGDQKGTLVALDTDTGEEKWHYKTDTLIRFPPAVGKRGVFLGSADGTLYKLNIETGKLEWKYSVANSIEDSPVVRGNSVYIGTSNGKLISLDIQKKKLKWKFDVEGFIVTQPAIDNNRAYIGSNDGKLYALDSENGEPLWVFDSGGNFVNQVAVANNQIYTIANSRENDKSICTVLAFRSGLYPGVKVTVYAGKENPLFAWIADFFSASAKEILSTKSNTLSEEINYLLTWPIGFYNITVINSLAEMFSKPSSLASQPSLDNISRFLISGISICGFTCLFSLTPSFLIFLSGFMISIWSLTSLIFLLANSGMIKLATLGVGTEIAKSKTRFALVLLRDAFGLTLRHLKLVILIFFQAAFVIMLSWFLFSYLNPIEVWSFYLVIAFAWILATMFSCLTHAHCLIQINRELGQSENNPAIYYFGRVLAISLTYILLSLIILTCLGAGKSYNLNFLSTFGVALITLAFVLLPFSSSFAVLNNQSYFSSIISSIDLALSNLISTMIYLLLTVLAFGLSCIIISTLNTLPFIFLIAPVSLFLSSFVAVYLLNLQCITFKNLTTNRSA